MVFTTGAMFPLLLRGWRRVYFPIGVAIFSQSRRTSGRLIWSHKISDYDGVEGAISRVSPAVHGNQVIMETFRIQNRCTTART